MKQLVKFILCLSLSFVFWPLTIWIIVLKHIYKFVWKMFIILKTLPRDIRYMYIMTNFTSKMFYCQQQECSVVSLFRDLLKKYPTKPCCYFENQVYTYHDIEDYSNKVANVFQSQNYKKGDVISLVMENCTEYVCIWLGLAKIGVTTALINTNLRGKSLIHCINSPKSKAIIYSEELTTAIENIKGDINLTLDRYQFGGKTPSNSEVYSLNDLLTKAPTLNPTFECPKFNDSLLYIYTSGTTGFPKPVIINHSRFIFFTYYAQELLSLQTGDIIYTPIPLYHTAGGVLGLGAALILGVPIAIRKKFSASAYFSDCAKFKCTVGQYIGEIGRYIISTPKKPEDKFHNVKKMIGVGMRSPVWKVLKTRFGVKDIVEMYGATESNIVFGNLSGKLGSFGYIPRCVPQSMSPFSVIKINVETGEPIRGKDGFCIRCDVGESGMLIGKIISGDPVLDFTGYLDEKATKSKILHNVFLKDDKAFMSGL
uniref:Long-chain-fatty-acid--CoA ligase n=1 Tax=Clastoptera arizonana TaxID=38151 RepID=A0A1B6DM00_9HEMI